MVYPGDFVDIVVPEEKSRPEVQALEQQNASKDANKDSQPQKSETFYEATSTD